MCGELLGFTPPNDNKTLVGQRILISRLVEAIAAPLPHDATEIQIHQYARCYILALVGVVVAWPGCKGTCVGQVRKAHRKLEGHAPWSSIGHGQGCHSCARG